MPTKSFLLNVYFACNNWLITWSHLDTQFISIILIIVILRFSYVEFKNCIALAKSSIACNLDPLQLGYMQMK